MIILFGGLVESPLEKIKMTPTRALYVPLLHAATNQGIV